MLCCAPDRAGQGVLKPRAVCRACVSQGTVRAVERSCIVENVQCMRTPLPFSRTVSRIPAPPRPWGTVFVALLEPPPPWSLVVNDVMAGTFKQDNAPPIPPPPLSVRLLRAPSRRVRGRLLLRLLLQRRLLQSRPRTHVRSGRVGLRPGLVRVKFSPVVFQACRGRALVPVFPQNRGRERGHRKGDRGGHAGVAPRGAWCGGARRCATVQQRSGDGVCGPHVDR